jgi:restriction system protein
MHENSLFSILLRSPWWASALVGAGIFVLVRIWFAVVYAAFAALPFIIIAAYVGWKQLRQPSAAQVAKRIEALKALPAEEFAQAFEAGFRREGYGVARLKGEPVDFELSKGGRVSVVLTRRWKAVRVGREPLEELEALRKDRKADECIYVTAGEVSDSARKFAFDSKVKLIEGPGLVALLS